MGSDEIISWNPMGSDEIISWNPRGSNEIISWNPRGSNEIISWNPMGSSEIISWNPTGSGEIYEILSIKSYECNGIWWDSWGILWWSYWLKPYPIFYGSELLIIKGWSRKPARRYPPTFWGGGPFINPVLALLGCLKSQSQALEGLTCIHHYFR